MSPSELGDRASGRAVGVLLIEAPGDAASRLAFLAGRLARAGYAVRTVQVDDKASWQSWHACAVAGLADLRRSCGIVIAGGVSTGAAMALLLAAEHPEDVQGTALFAPTLWLSGWLTPWASGLVCTALGRRMVEAIGISPWLARHFGISGGALAEHRRLVAAARGALRAIRQPALIVHSREDRCVGLDNAGYLQRHLSGLVDMVVLGNSNPGGGIGRQDDLIVEKAARFIDAVAKRTQPAAQIKRPVPAVPARAA